MFYTLCARVLMIVVNCNISVPAAIDYVLRNMPKALRKAMAKHIAAEVDLLVYGEIVIDLDEELERFHWPTPEENNYVL